MSAVPMRSAGWRFAWPGSRVVGWTRPSPYVDGVLPSGVRLHAILPPLVADGPHLTLRVPARSPR